MILIIFLIIFIIISIVLYFFGKKQIIDFSSTDGIYTTKYVKGTARGSIGYFISNSELEVSRMIVNSKKSKF